MGCKNICLKYRAVKKDTNSRYASGQKRCQVCQIFINWNGLYCPCCKYRLRVKPRGKVAKRSYQNVMQARTESKKESIIPEEKPIIERSDDSPISLEAIYAKVKQKKDREKLK